MPQGVYSFHDPHDGTPRGGERFICAPGPMGWRYTGSGLPGPGGAGSGSSRTVDLTVDARGRPLRVELVARGWRVRGGTAAVDGAAGVLWVRGPADPDVAEEPVEGRAKAVGFAGRSPAFLVAAARLLGLAPGQSVRVRLVDLTEPVLAPHPCDQAWALTGIEEHPTPIGPLAVSRYEVADLATGVRGVVHLAGDVVLAAPGVELEELDGPPNRVWPG
ncbi:hypothetical protein LO772_21750 [Yinghuangia sp. ASG 101]|uniref:hypothetical protein n=1 Tax=Yinghuangia sp. ASG 101 TaxID=2896848 RepID=UPI001E36259E|nr:hypothetical protein [Yinghuangia sp. ASG 101]UGQ09549.1 hypothetical protein LO772_21750 [Yinghuangia sp. ASG 101]